MVEASPNGLFFAFALGRRGGGERERERSVAVEAGDKEMEERKKSVCFGFQRGRDFIVGASSSSCLDQTSLFIGRTLQLEEKLHQLQSRLENLMWDQKKLQEHFQMAVKERKMMELLLAELEEEHGMAIAEIEKLERKNNMVIKEGT